MKSYEERLAICQEAYDAYDSCRKELEDKIRELALRQRELIRAQRAFKDGDKVRHMPSGKIGFIEYRTKNNQVYFEKDLHVILKDIKKDGTKSAKNVFGWVKPENEFELVKE